MRLTGCLGLTLFFFVSCLLPLLFFDFAMGALENLHLTRTQALLVLFGLLFGSVINLPVARYPLDEEVIVPVFETFGWEVSPRFRRLRREMIVAVNVGGCVVPVLLAIRLLRIVVDVPGSRAIIVLCIATTANVAVCYRMARPIPKLGIALPFPFLPALVAISAAWIGLGSSEFDTVRAPVAFIAGIAGPLVGADLLHWKDFKSIGAGMVSIGGAGTLDGIVLTGLLAAVLT